MNWYLRLGEKSSRAVLDASSETLQRRTAIVGPVKPFLLKNLGMAYRHCANLDLACCGPARPPGHGGSVDDVLLKDVPETDRDAAIIHQVLIQK